MLDRLDAAGRCPLCQGDIASHQDNALGGSWLSCPVCRFTGKPLELARRVLDLDTPGVLDALREPGDPRYGSQEVAAWADAVTSRKKVADLWALARVQAPRSQQSLRPLRTHLSEPQLAPEEWRLRGGALIGLVSHEDAETALGRVPFERRWSEAVVLALEDLPGRLSGLWLSSEERGRRQEAVVTALPPLRGAHGLLLAGGATIEHRGRLGGTLFVVLDAVLAVKLQLWHLQTNLALLPLVGLLPTAPSPVGLGAGRDVVVWAGSPCVDAFRHARALSARLVFCTAKNKTVFGQLHDYDSAEVWAAREAARAVSWQAALDAVLLDLPRDEAARLLTGLDMPAAELCQHARTATPATRRRLAELTVSTAPFVVVGNKKVVERSDGWFVEATNERIASFRLVVDEIVRVTPPGGLPIQTHLRGRLLTDGREIHFCELESTMSADPLAWARDFLLSRGMLAVRAPGWAKQALRLAFEFSPPTVRAVSGVFGLDRPTWRLSLPDWSVDLATGKVTESLADPPESLRLSFRPPLPPPGFAPSPEDWASLRLDRPRNDLFWAVVAWSLSSMLSDRDAVGPCLAVPQTSWLLEVLRQAGFVALVCDLRRSEGRSLAAMAAASGLPSQLTCQGRVPAEWFAEASRHLVVLPDRERLCLPLTHDHWFAHPGGGDDSPPLDSEIRAADMLVWLWHAYLKGLGGRGVPTPMASIDDLATWVLDQAGHRSLTPRLRAGLCGSWSPGSLGELLGDVLTGLLAEGKLWIVPEKFCDPCKGHLPRLAGGILLSRGLLEQALKTELDWKLVLAALEAAGGLAGAGVARGLQGPLLDEAWLARRRLRGSMGMAKACPNDRATWGIARSNDRPRRQTS